MWAVAPRRGKAGAVAVQKKAKGEETKADAVAVQKKGEKKADAVAVQKGEKTADAVQKGETKADAVQEGEKKAIAERIRKQRALAAKLRAGIGEPECELKPKYGAAAPASALEVWRGRAAVPWLAVPTSSVKPGGRAASEKLADEEKAASEKLADESVLEWLICMHGEDSDEVMAEKSRHSCSRPAPKTMPKSQPRVVPPRTAVGIVAAMKKAEAAKAAAAAAAATAATPPPKATSAAASSGQKYGGGYGDQKYGGEYGDQKYDDKEYGYDTKYGGKEYGYYQKYGGKEYGDKKYGKEYGDEKYGTEYGDDTEYGDTEYGKEYGEEKKKTKRGTKRRAGKHEQEKRKLLMAEPQFGAAMAAFFAGKESAEQMEVLRRAVGGSGVQELWDQREEAHEHQ